MWTKGLEFSFKSPASFMARHAVIATEVGGLGSFSVIFVLLIQDIV